MMKGNWNVYSMNLDGSELKKEAENSAFDSTISVSNDGKNLAYAVIIDKAHKVKVRNTDSKITKTF